MEPVIIEVGLMGSDYKQLIRALSNALSTQGTVYVPYIAKKESEEATEHFIPELGVALNVIVVLGSAGVFTAAYKVICKWLERNKAREVTIVRDQKRITIRGHSVPDEKSLLAELLGKMDD